LKWIQWIAATAVDGDQLTNSKNIRLLPQLDSPCSNSMDFDRHSKSGSNESGPVTQFIRCFRTCLTRPQRSANLNGRPFSSAYVQKTLCLEVLKYKTH